MGKVPAKRRPGPPVASMTRSRKLSGEGLSVGKDSSTRCGKEIREPSSIISTQSSRVGTQFLIRFA